MICRASWLLTPEGVLEDGVVELDGERIVAVRPARAGDPPALDGGLVPGLVNAHCHLDLSWLSGRVSNTGAGFADWVRRQLNARQRDPGPQAREQAAREAAQQMHASGVAAVCDLSNDGSTLQVVVESGLLGVVQHELLTFSADLVAARMAEAEQIEGRRGGVWLRPSPHAVYSTAPQLIRAAARPGPVPGSIHLGEDPAEREFVTHGRGPLADLLDALGVDWRWWDPVGLAPTAYLDALGVLGPGLLLVHGVDLDAADRALIAERGASVCLCPRSNLFVGRRLPDVPALIDAGVRLCVGTDSLASVEGSLDLFEELRVLAHTWPQIPPTHWLQLATRDGAAALGLVGLGRLEAGASPGVVWLEGASTPEEALFSQSRRWLVEAARVS